MRSTLKAIAFLAAVVSLVVVASILFRPSPSSPEKQVSSPQKPSIPESILIITPEEQGDDTLVEMFSRLIKSEKSFVMGGLFAGRESRDKNEKIDLKMVTCLHVTLPSETSDGRLRGWFHISGHPDASVNTWHYFDTNDGPLAFLPLPNVSLTYLAYVDDKLVDRNASIHDLNEVSTHVDPFIH